MDFHKEELSKNSYLLFATLPEEIKPNFEELWNSKPKEKGKVRIRGMWIETPRWHASYLNKYQFSGQTPGNKDTKAPKNVLTIFDYVNKHSDYNYNQILVNWYLNGSHYIGVHSDDERQLAKDSNIFSVSLGATRKFRIRDKSTNKIVKDFELKDGSVVIMCGKMQKEYKHEIVKIQGNKGLIIKLKNSQISFYEN